MEQHIWCERYRPQKISEAILPKRLKDTFQEMVNSGAVQNMLFTGSSGLGKTTVAKAICNELGLDYLLVNASDDKNIDTLRGKIKQFATSVSLSGNKKVIILDEADYLNAQSTQPALRGAIEQFSGNCQFILTCNFKNRILEAIHSRCGVYEFNTTKKELASLSKQMHSRLKSILEEENVKYDDKTVAEYILKYLPDWRRTINEIQRNSISGELLPIVNQDATEYDVLYAHLKNKDFGKMRKWVVANMDVDSTVIFRHIYNRMEEYIKPQNIPQLVLILADYSYKNAFVVDREINVVACFTEIMSSVEFK